MIASELRIGNWVNEDVIGVCKVTSIDSLIVGVESNKITIIPDDYYNIPFLYSLNIDNIQPVPLTPEILKSIEISNNKTGYGTTTRGGEKVQWDFNYQKVYLDAKGVFYFVSHTDDFGDFQHGIILKSLHQLQNLYFALTNEELMIEDLEDKRSVATTAK